MIQARSHDHNVLLVCVSSPEHFAQVIEVLGVPHGNHDIAWPHAEGFVLRLFVSIDAELVEALRLSRSFSRHAPLGIRKESKENQTESDAADGRLIFGEEVYQRRDEQHGRNQNYAEGKFAAFAKGNISGHLPFTFCRLGVAQYEHS